MSMSLERFAEMHGLPERWLSLRRRCETLARHPQFWSRPELQDAARQLAAEASDILREQGNLLCSKSRDTKIA